MRDREETGSKGVERKPGAIRSIYHGLLRAADDYDKMYRRMTPDERAAAREALSQFFRF
jgi:hypothetical protein